MTSAKNTLQEYFQKNNFNLPTYISLKGEDNLWISTVKIILYGDSYDIESGQYKKKKQAECSAAFNAIEKIKSIKIENTHKEIKITNLYPIDKLVINDSGKYVLVDYENISRLKNISQIKSDFILLKFVSHCHPKALTGEANFIIESSIKDAVDHFISFYIGRLVNHHKNNLLICVLTRDHFASSYESFIKDKTIKIVHCPSESKVLEILIN